MVSHFALIVLNHDSVCPCFPQEMQSQMKAINERSSGMMDISETLTSWLGVGGSSNKPTKKDKKGQR